MYFANPGILWFLLALLIPLVIHFFKFKKPIVIVFSQVKFIQNINIESKNKRRIKHLLLLLSRLLILFFVILLFAEPHFKSNFEERSSVIFIIDNSLSMSGESNDGVNPLNFTLKWVEEFVKRAPVGTNFKLFALGDRSFTSGWITKKQILDRITEVNPSHFTQSINQVMNQIGKEGINSAIYFLSDFQKGPFDLLFDSSLVLTGNDFFLVPVLTDRASNVYVDTVYLKNLYFMPGVDNDLFIRLKNDGNSNKSVNIRVIENENLIASNSVKIEPLLTVDLLFPLAYERIIDGNLRIELDDYPIIFDNNFFISLSRFEPIPIQYLYQTKPNVYLETVFENKDFFDFKSNQISSVDYESISTSSLIIIDGFDKIPEAFYNLSSDITIILIPSLDADLTSYAKFLGTNLTLKSDTASWPLQFNSQSDYLYEGLFDENIYSGDLPASRILIVPDRFNEMLIYNNFKVPFLTRLKANRNLFFFSSPLSTAYTNFPTHGIFLPIMYRLAQLSQSGNSTLYLNEEVKNIGFKLRNLDFSEITISHNDQILTPDYQLTDQKVIIKLDKDEMKPGHYEVLQGDHLLGSFSMNISKGESIMLFFENKELEEFATNFPNIYVMDTSGFEEGQIQSSALTEPSDLWKYALVLALFFIVTEIMILRFVK